jgi:hypothetical protein
LYDQCQQQTKNDHGSDRKIKFEIFPFEADISGQATNPVQFVMKKINDDANNDHKQSDSDDPFTGFTVHVTKLLGKFSYAERLSLCTKNNQQLNASIINFQVVRTDAY